MAKIFLCHASEDKPQVEAIYRRLRQEGYQPWMDKMDLLPGQQWRQEIPKALKTSDFILVFLSRNSIAKRSFVQREFKLALDTLEEIPTGEIHTIPVRLDACDVPESFRDFHWCDLFEVGGFERMVRAIRHGITQRQQSQPASQQSTTETVTTRERTTAPFSTATTTVDISLPSLPKIGAVGAVDTRTGSEQRQQPQKSSREVIESAQTKVPDVPMGIDTLPDLTPIDTFVLKLACEESIAIGNIYIETSAILPKAAEANILHNEVRESIDILDRKGYVEATRTNTGIPHFSITLSGFDEYANHFIPEYQTIFQLVIAKIVNDHVTQNKMLSSSVNQPRRIIDHILRVLHSKNLLHINSTLEGYEAIDVSNISPELRRMVGNNATP